MENSKQKGGTLRARTLQERERNNIGELKENDLQGQHDFEKLRTQNARRH